MNAIQADVICGKQSPARRKSRAEVVEMLEKYIGLQMDIRAIAIIHDVHEGRIGQYLKDYYFPYRGENKEVITLKSKV